MTATTRNFFAKPARVRCHKGTVLQMDGAFTFMAMLRLPFEDIEGAILSGLDSELHSNEDFYLLDMFEGKLEIYVNGQQTISPIDLTDFAGRWVVVAVAKAAGKAPVRWMVYDVLEDVPNYSDSENTPEAEDAAGSPDIIQFGTYGSGSNEQLRARLAAIAAWDKKLNDAEMLEVAKETLLSDWLDHEPDALWLFKQATAETHPIDQTGNEADGFAQTGTTVSTESPPRKYVEGDELGGTEPMPDEPGEEEEEPASVKVRVDGELVDGKRFVRVGGELVPV